MNEPVHAPASAPESASVSDLAAGLRLPVIVAPMFLISGPDLVIAAGRAGLLGAFPAPNARTLQDLAGWLARIEQELAASGRPGQWAMNMIVHPTYTRCEAELDLLSQYRPRLVITALGGPRRVMDRAHGFGAKVFTDVINTAHARKAIDAGADGLVLVAAGAGGHTGALSPFVFVDAVRQFWDGPIVLGGGVGNARAIRAALDLGADFAYMGTRFIAARESLAPDDYRQMLVQAGAEDIVTTAAISGVRGNWLRASLERSGFDFSLIERAKKIDFSSMQGDTKAWKTIWSAGQSVGSVRAVQPVADIAEELATDFSRLRTAPSPWR
jgi:nitronate monooxygenase